jgi:4,5-dihydroxyphthalate decarboxylase
LYKAFGKAKEHIREKLFDKIPAALFFAPEYLAMTEKLLGEDPFPYGIKANSAMLETITAYSYEQGLTPRKMDVKELFAESTLDC